MRPNHGFVARLVLAMTIVMAGCHAVAAAELAIPPRDRSERCFDPDRSAELHPMDRRVRQLHPRRQAAQPPVCSNIGFACQPKAIRCLGAQ